jgi:hypothetical protein
VKLEEEGKKAVGGLFIQDRTDKGLTVVNKQVGHKLFGRRLDSRGAMVLVLFTGIVFGSSAWIHAYKPHFISGHLLHCLPPMHGVSCICSFRFSCSLLPSSPPHMAALVSLTHHRLVFSFCSPLFRSLENILAFFPFVSPPSWKSQIICVTH